ncbi:ER membrane protein complex subunit 2-like [Diaphorina citri]|uniref:ER membrane protein complex subunit 2 n=1 Tax=Diaphorina citri TaxID=121845 RepID=A0A1S3D242_DIACI|nr:ER membrane protein complex subunit 2-like [Diaphorina citri]
MELTKQSSWNKARDILKDWRDNNQRRSVEVIEIWENSLASKIHKLGDDRFVVLEQVSVAALDCNRLDVAASCIHSLIKEFPNSLRVRTLLVMKLEAQQRYEEALEHLETIIKIDETNTAARKRKICILKAKNKIPEAIKELTEYLKKFMTDQETWQELCDLYLSEGDYAKAVFCMEELFLHHPHNHLLHQRYADILYTQGGLENIELAISHYLMAINLNEKNIRALYGLALSCHQVLTSAKCSAAKKKEISKQMMWVSKHLARQYEEQQGNTETLTELMSALQVS